MSSNLNSARRLLVGILIWLSITHGTLSALAETPTAGDIVRESLSGDAVRSSPMSISPPTAAITAPVYKKPYLGNAEETKLDIVKIRIEDLPRLSDDEQTELCGAMSNCTPPLVCETPLTSHPDSTSCLVDTKIARSKMTLGSLFRSAMEVRRYLVSKGYVIADSFVPIQTIKPEDPVVKIVVLKGRLGKIVMPPREALLTYGVTPELLLGYIEKRLAEGDIVKSDSLERVAYLLGDLKGVRIDLRFEPGDKPGTANLIVGAKCARSPFDKNGKSLCGGAEWKVDVDGNGSYYTGVTRAGIGGEFLNLGGVGDLLTLRYAASIEGRGMSFARASYLTPVNFDGLRLGLAHTELNYRLGTALFTPLDASGSAAINTALATYPVVRSRLFNLVVSAQIDERSLIDRQNAVKRFSEKSALGTTIGVSGDYRDLFGGSIDNRGGINVFSLSHTRGDIGFRGEQAEAFRAADQAGHKTAGPYQKTNFSYVRLQGGFVEGLAAYIVYNGQVASKNLDSSEKFSLGGPDAVRAYPPGEAPGDEGWTATAELRWHLPIGLFPTGRNFPGNWTLAFFHDAGKSRLNKNPIPGTDLMNSRKIAGVGVGLNWEASKKVPGYSTEVREWSARLSIATPQTDSALGENVRRNPRVYGQAIWYR